ncbi:MAG: RNA recognition motif domain-containing protein [Phycisphaerales bacterium JB038]
MGMKIYVGNLSFQSTESEIEELFSGHGQVTQVTLITDRETGRPRGFGFVEMADDGEAQAAISALDGQEFGGRNLKVNEARPRNDSRGGGGGGGRGRSSGGGGRRW